jgi:hypothetical protein
MSPQVGIAPGDHVARRLGETPRHQAAHRRTVREDMFRLLTDLIQSGIQ